MLSLNERELLEVLLNENYWRSTFGALEYDPEVFMPLQKSQEDEPSGSPNMFKYGSPNKINQSQDRKRDLSPTMIHDIDNLSMVSNFSQSTAGRRTNIQLNQGGIEPSFRDFLESKVKFKEVVTIGDPQIVSCIHLSYKLTFLKDTAMARFIDDTTSHTIMQLISSMHQ